MCESGGILCIGGHGLVGSRLAELLGSALACDIQSRRTGLDITDARTTREKIVAAPQAIVLHLAAKTDVEGCEQERALGRRGGAWLINVEGTRNVARACEESGKRLIYLSTDCVFGQQAVPAGGFTEHDLPRPLNWYGQTKYEAETIVQQLRTPWLIARIACPYRAKSPHKDFVRTFLALLQQGRLLKLVTDHLVSPTFIDDIALALDVLVRRRAVGIYHLAGGQSVSPYQVGLALADLFGLDRSCIEPINRAEFFKNRAPRPASLALNIEKIRRQGVQMSTLQEGLRKVGKQLRLLDDTGSRSPGGTLVAL